MDATLKRERAMSKLVCGLGVCDIATCVSSTCKVAAKWYVTWRDVVARCVPSKCKHLRSYKGCTLDPRWVKASSFKKWFDKHYVEGYHLDKDILVPGNKVYGPGTCCFVPREINNTLLRGNQTDIRYPQGVSFVKKLNKLKVAVSVGTSRKILGYFAVSDVESASACYNEAKRDHIISMARAYYTDGKISAKVKNALVRRARQFVF